MIHRLALLLLVALTGCAAFPAILAGVAQGAQLLGSALDLAETGAEVYNARHPNQEREDAIRQALAKSRAALVALNAAVASGKAADDGDTVAARKAALEAYEQLRSLLDETGVLGAVPAAGGAETAAPKPEPLALPPVAAIEAAL
jgi:hypothetical protein